MAELVNSDANGLLHSLAALCVTQRHPIERLVLEQVRSIGTLQTPWISGNIMNGAVQSASRNA